MSQLIQIKQRIRSIKATKKITLAMRLISMSLYSRLDEQKITVETFKQSVLNLFDKLQPHFKDWQNPTLFPVDILDETPLFIFTSSTKGLCGGLNANLNRYKDSKFFIEEHQKPTFITIGKRAEEYVSENKFGNIIYQYNELNSNNLLTVAEKITQSILTAKTPYSSVTFYSSYLKNFFVQAPQKTIVIPFTKSTNNDTETENITFEDEPIWEQSKEKIADYIANKYINASIVHLLFQALISEHAARFVAMDSATTNAEKYLDTLTLQFNKTRQGLITREVSELSANL
jgi:F-type H+-transporting ATPase subunit gamma